MANGKPCSPCRCTASGRLNEAEEYFQKAEKIQKEREPYPIMYSFQGFRYCDLLLSQGKYGEVINRAVKTIEIEIRNKWLLTIALDHLSLGRAYLLKAQAGNGDFTQANKELDQAVNVLRQSGSQDVLPSGLLARASLRRICKDFDKAQHDVDEALAIADRGDMKLHLSDCHLEYARLYLAMGKKDEAKANLGEAKVMINSIGYHRRDAEVADLEAQLN